MLQILELDRHLTSPYILLNPGTITDQQWTLTTEFLTAYAHFKT